QAGGQALPLVVDVRDEAAVKGAIAQTVTRFGSLDIVVNNASAISLTPVAQTDMKRFDLMHQNAAKSYAKPAEIGQPMVGGTVGEIVNSRHPNFSVGDVVLGHGGWQEYAISNGKGLRKLDATIAPVSTALGVLGMPGMTAYVGLLEVGQPKPDETVVVAAASGAVGSAG